MDRPSPEELRDLYVGQSLSTWEISSRFGVSQMTVRRWMRRAGIEGRPHTENKMPTLKGGSHSWGAKISTANKGNPKVGRANAGKRGADAPNWKGGEHRRANGRRYIWDPDAKRYFPRAVVVWRRENNGQPVGTGYVIHHRDGDSENDSPENLVRLSAKEHVTLHRRREREYIEMLQKIILDLGGIYPPMHLLD
jgi:hypothetical protein